MSAGADYTLLESEEYQEMSRLRSEFALEVGLFLRKFSNIPTIEVDPFDPDETH